MNPNEIIGAANPFNSGVSAAAALIQGTARMLDTQLAAVRSFWQAQAKTGASFGLPDWSPALEGQDHVFENASVLMIDVMRRFAAMGTEVQSRVLQLGELQTDAARRGARAAGEAGEQIVDATGKPVHS